MTGMLKTRYIESFITKFLEKKMVFVGGPRQVGKTTLCIQYLSPPTIENPAYMNWDDLKNKKALRQGELPNAPIVVLDEIHKYRDILR